MKDFYNEELKDIYKELDTSVYGLSSVEAKKRMQKYGKNELNRQEQDSLLKILFGELFSPMEIILLIAIIFSIIIGEYVDAVTLIIIVAVDVFIGTFEEWKAKKDVSSLINMIKVKSNVVRDGKEVEIDSSELVIGDIIFLTSGDKISADARIIECHNFQVDESSLTGESIGILKNNDTIKKDTILSERFNMIYAGTNVITGRCMAVVTGTSINTEIGKIADQVSNTKEEKSPLTIRIDKFVKQISILIVSIAFLLTIILVLKNYDIGKIIINVIALSVSAMPEGLALALTMALTIASKKMYKKNVIVKNLNSVESLGSCTVIATDKTGTLTVNEQTARKILLKNGEEYDVTGTGYNDNGEVTSNNNDKIDLAKEIAFLGYINNEAHLKKEKNKWNYFGDTIDIALLSLAKKLKIDNKPKIIETIPYESENQYSAVFYEKDGKLYCTVKGALEKVMYYSEVSDEYKKHNDYLTSNGYRVIAFANGVVSDTNIENVKDLDYVGMIGFIDPIRTDVKKSIKLCHKAGIKVIMITGDHPLTAGAIAKDLELITDDKEVATGVDVQNHRKQSDAEFDRFISCVKVFSRVTPLDKLEIVNSLKRQGEFVAVTGDGVNDAPAIKSANIGISMGSGTDVAKESASMIINNDNFTSIVDGVREGRTAYNNIRKIVLFLLSCGFAEVSFFIFSILFGFDIPLVAIQLLWLNIVTDGLQDIALSFEKTENDVMYTPPRSSKESLFSKDLVTEILIIGITISIVVFGTWIYLVNNNYDLAFSRSVIMMLMVFIQNINVLNCISEKNSIFKIKLLKHPFVLFTIIGSILLQLLFPSMPFTAKALKVVPLSFETCLLTFMISLIVILVFEIYKYSLNNKW